MQPLRLVLGFPVGLLQLVANLVAWTMRMLGRLLGWVSFGWMRHVYYPICVARRIVHGEPRWKLCDFQLGIPPRSGAARALATGAGFTTVPCDCGKSGCLKETWVPLAFLQTPDGEEFLRERGGAQQSDLVVLDRPPDHD